MRVPRFFIDDVQIDVETGVIRITEAPLLDQIRKVLRLEHGDRIDLLDSRGSIFHCTLEAGPDRSKREISMIARIVQRELAQGEPYCCLTVALPVLRSGRFEWAVEKLTEIGASKIIPLSMERSVVHISAEHFHDDRIVHKLRRWRAVAREAAEQCERALIPDVTPLVKLVDLLELRGNINEDSHLLLCAERSSAIPLGELLNKIDLRTAEICCVVGPEGGFTDREFALAREKGCTFVSLGRRILRSETAAVFAAAVVVSHLDNQPTFNDTKRDIT